MTDRNETYMQRLYQRATGQTNERIKEKQENHLLGAKKHAIRMRDLQAAIDSLVAQIIDNFDDSIVEEAIQNGMKRALVFRGEGTFGDEHEVEEDGVKVMIKRYPVTFLVGGPLTGHHTKSEFFKHNNIISVYDQLSKHFKPFLVYTNIHQGVVELVLAWNPRQ